MTDKQIQAAFDSSRNLFLTGPAGTGKSYLLNRFIEGHDNVLMCAPTGIAALNLGGDTMHRLFHIPVPCYESPSFAKNNKKAVPKSVLKTLVLADVIIIDEISMCRADVFSYAIKVLRKAEKLKGSKIRLIVSGDFSQLPPVVKKGDDKLLRKFGFDPSGFPFTTREWKSMNFKTVELVEIKRQSDQEFIQNLNAIRVGNFKDVGYFDRFIGNLDGFEDAIYICGTNAEADKMNREYLDSLPGAPAVFMARKEGWGANNIVDDIVLLKPGARVIFTANDTQKGRYKNGSFGLVKAVGTEGATIEIDGKDYSILPQTWPVYNYSITGGKLNKKEIGSVSQLPVKLAKAITIHRSQGQTFDKVVISPDVFAPGQLYVALSRVRTPEGMRLLRPITKADLILDGTVQKFYKNGYDWPVKKPAAKKSAKTETKKASKTVDKKPVNKTPKTVKRPAAKKSAAKPKTGTKAKKTVLASKPKKAVRTASKK